MTALDKSLDEIITEKRIQTQRRGGPPQSGGNRDRDRAGLRDTDRRDRLSDDIGPARRSNAPRPSADPYSRRVITYDQPVEPRARPASSSQEARVLVEGLDPAWEARDIREIFQEQGHPIQRVFMHWDRSGRSEGSCEMTLETMGLAKALVNDMDGAEVDGFPLTISIVRGSPAPRGGGPSDPPLGRGRDLGRDSGRDARGPIRERERSPLRDSGRGGGGKGKGAGRRDRELMTKEELDAELDRMRR